MRARGYEGVLIADAADEDWGDDWLPDDRTESVAGSRTRAPSILWSVVLETYTGPGHAEAAATMVRELPRVSPELSAANVRSKTDGSTVVYGAYAGVQDADAQRDLAWIKGIEIQGRKVFPMAMLSRFRTQGPAMALHPYDLMNARKRFPRVDPLYTMEVAVWGIFGAGSPTMDEIQRSAEAYCMQLRTSGNEAFFLHDEGKQLSIVTVGLFDSRAIDMRSGFYSPDVDALFQRFPAHLYNGEPLNELIDRDRPYRGTKVQTPRLVLVPE